MKKRLWIGLTAGIVTLAVVLGLIFWDVLFPSKEGAAYTQAVAELKKAGAVTMDVTQKITTRLGEDSFQLTVDQVLSYGALDTKNPIVQLEETFPDSTTAPYAERYGKGTLYVEWEDSAAFRGKLSQVDALKRYAPVGLLDAQRYRQITTETEDDKTVVRFADPNAGESWAMPKGARLVTASGTAELDKNGKILKTGYTVTYTQGAAEITLEAVAKVREKAKKFSLPDGDGFTELTCVDAPRMLAHTQARLQNLPSVTATVAEYNIYEKDGKIRGDSSMVTSSTLQMCHGPDGLQYKIDTDMVSGTSGTEKTVTYQNGEYAKKIGDGGFMSGSVREQLTDGEAAGRFYESLTLCTVEPKYWKDVTLTELNGVYYLEFIYTDQWGVDMHNGACSKACTDYSVQEMSGYLAVDKTTGLVTASGFRTELWHRVAHLASILIQKDMSLQSPSVGAHLALTGSFPQEQVPENPATPLLYRVTGSNGQEMWLFGTIHVGDARTAYLPRKVYDILLASDALALEFDQEKFEKDLQEKDYMAQNVAYLYNYINSKTKEHMDPEAYELALKYIKASGNFRYDSTGMKVSVWQNIISNFYLQLGHRYDPEKGMEMRLTQLAKAYNKPIREVESAMSQIEMFTRWSEDLQRVMMDSTLQTTLDAYLQETHNLYELWCAGDEEALRKEINKQMVIGFGGEQEKLEALLAEYDKGMNEDRNKKMLKVAITYLESQDTVFYAVGLAHLLDDTSGLVDGLRQAGYTVELVKYN